MKEYKIEFRCDNCKKTFEERVPFGFEARFSVYRFRCIVVPTNWLSIFGLDGKSIECHHCGSLRVEKRG